jgi:hypothetical protein
MRPEEALQRAGEPEALEAVRVDWETGQALLPADGPGFLQPVSIRESLAWCGFDPCLEEAVLRAAQRIRADEALLRLAWQCDWRLYDAPEQGGFTRWPAFESALGEDAGLFYLLVGLDLAPRLRAFHARLGISEAVTRETLQEPRAFSLNYAQMHPGRLGLPRSQVFWLRYYLYEKFFRLGRFEYWLKRFRGGVRAYRSRRTGQALALVPDGARLDACGYMPRKSDPPRPGEWTARLVEEDGRVEGTPVLPTGRAGPQPVTLDLEEWAPVLSEGDWVLDFHIPAGGGMTPGACHDSFRRAAAFFAERFPETPAVAFACFSWIYNPDLERILPAGSNLALNLGDAYLFPIPSGGDDGLWFIFFQDRLDLATASRRTSVQRAVWDWLAAGHPWRSGGMFYLTADLDRLGTQIYRRQGDG